ncbi:MAG: biotin/lipoyl-binding carrier protein [Candidatus Calescibacterium sp.]|nr:biotin/lipoyl-binding carrier protein [Candidatus Calescibacterium sp.]MCX7733383.1 biotin/lipoyl-binding carrier protein [bacterium]MDW8087475.1 biotin/lipoyl-binding carrier protein [Candidatus Calescibacterium sp.]
MAEKVLSPITANVWKVLVKEGDRVSEGTTIVILESMKMEIPVDSPVNGVVKKLYVSEGGSVGEGEPIADIE